MKKIVLFDPSYGTLNMGDLIINEAVMKEMSYLFDSSFTVRFGTHNPLLQHIQLLHRTEVSLTCREATYKFLGGTNLLKYNLAHINQGWGIDIATSSLYRGSISLGCGVGGNAERTVNSYTRQIYKNALSDKYIHSVRDETSRKFLERLGFEAYDTGCPTLWGFDDELNESIPEGKSENVIFTLTDYDPSPTEDQKLINILNKNYRDVYFWVQGSGDYAYLQQFTGIENINIINPTLGAYSKVLARGGVDYVGNRLHAGIYAMQHGVRSVIVAVDHRAREMHASHNLNVIERRDMDGLADLVESSFATRVKIDHQLIRSWKSQFQPS